MPKEIQVKERTL